MHARTHDVRTFEDMRTAKTQKSEQQIFIGTTLLTQNTYTYLSHKLWPCVPVREPAPGTPRGAAAARALHRAAVPHLKHAPCADTQTSHPV